MKCCFLTLALGAATLFGGVAPPPGGAAEDGEALLPGQSREVPVTAGETHVWRVGAADTPLLLTVEQLGVDLAVEAWGPAGSRALVADGLTGRWGPEILLLQPAGGEHRIAVSAPRRGARPGRYAISVAPLELDATDGARRLAAAEAMSRGGQLVARQTPEALREALADYRLAREGWSATGDRSLEAEALHAAAAVELQLGELPAATADFARAAALWRELRREPREAAALDELGRAELSRGATAAASREFTAAAALWQRLGEGFEAGEAHSHLCLAEQTGGALPAALACYEETRALFRELGDASSQARALNNLGGIHDLLGDPDAALSHYEQALALRRQLGDRAGEAQTLNNIATVHGAVGEWQEALRVYGQARELLAPLGDRLQEAALLNNIGFAYASVGEPQRALVSFEAALELRRLTGNLRGEVITLNNLGRAWRSLGDLEKALAHHRAAAERATALGDARQEAISRLRLSEVHLDRGDTAAALAEAGSALAHFAASGDRRNEAAALHLQGRGHALAGRPGQAVSLLEQALARRQALRDRGGEAETLHALATAERALGLAEEARAHAEEAIARVEGMRIELASLDLRAAFLATQRRAYELLIELLMDRHAADPAAGHDRAAFAVSERARARSLRDAIYAGGVQRTAGVPADLLAQRRLLRRRLSAKAAQELKQSGGHADALRRDIEALLAQLDDVEAEIQRRDPRSTSLAAPPALGAEVATLLGPDTLLLEVALGGERSFLWAVGAGTFRSFVLPPAEEIEKLARRAHEELRTVESGAAPGSSALEELGRILMRPVWSETERRPRLAIVADAALHLIPWSALPVPARGGTWAAGARQPLLELHEVVYLPSAATLALQRQRLSDRPPASRWAAVLADPVFAAQGPGGGGPAPFDPLPASRREADAIAALAPAGQVWTAVGAAASRDAALSGDLSGYRVVHLATHAVADTENPERSGLVLSLVDSAGRPREGFVGLPDIYELELDADLVVLSGCATALGREVRGEGVMGLTRAFLFAGAPRVVASLWRVQDRATAELMSRFYHALWREGLSPAAALRQAQRSLRREPRYRDPYAWAGFVLQGEWR